MHTKGFYPIYKSPAFHSFNELRKKDRDYNLNRAKYYLGRYFSVERDFRAAPTKVPYEHFKNAVNFKNRALELVNSNDLVEGCLVEYFSALIKIRDFPIKVSYEFFQKAVSSKNCALNLMEHLNWTDEQINEVMTSAAAKAKANKGRYTQAKAHNNINQLDDNVRDRDNREYVYIV